MTPLQRRLYDFLCAKADAGAPCPTNAEVAAILGGDDRDGSYMISALERAGKIVVHRQTTGRRIRIVGTGKATAWRLGHVDCVERPLEHGFRGPVPEELRVDRDPCPRCNVRRDIGCEHTASRLLARPAQGMGL